jgi:hypothetical protein
MCWLEQGADSWHSIGGLLPLLVRQSGSLARGRACGMFSCVAREEGPPVTPTVAVVGRCPALQCQLHLKHGSFVCAVLCSSLQVFHQAHCKVQLLSWWAKLMT